MPKELLNNKMKYCAASKLSEIDDRKGGSIEVIQPPFRSSICDVFTQRNASFNCLTAPKLTFSKCTFLASAYEEDQLPELKMTEVAIIGRSNVGKSSLINALFNGKKLAKVSSTPGKTASINFFCVDEQFCLVDLPGYGYAKVNEETKKKWSMLIDSYLNKRKMLRLILLLLDSRRLLSEQDKTFITWAAHHKIPILFIFTKTDKLKESELKRAIKENLTLLQPFFPHPHFLQYSIKEPRAKIELINQLNDFFYGRSK